MRLPWFRIHRQLLVDAFTFDLEVVGTFACVLDHECRLAGLHRRRHVELIFGHRNLYRLAFLSERGSQDERYRSKKGK